MDEMRALLDSLMGADRNDVSSAQSKNRKTFKDPGVCRYYLVGFCPHSIFINTKSDLGACPNQHSIELKKKFEADPEHEQWKWQFEVEFIDKLQRLINNVEHRIRRGNERVSGQDEQIEKDKEAKLQAMRSEVSAILKLAEETGEMGNIAEAEAHTAKANELRRKIEAISDTPVMPISAQEKSLRVCEICGAMQSTGDAASRFESHISGKQHTGYELIRSTLAQLREKHASGVPSSVKSGSTSRHDRYRHHTDKSRRSESREGPGVESGEAKRRRSQSSTNKEGIECGDGSSRHSGRSRDGRSPHRSRYDRHHERDHRHRSNYHERRYDHRNGNEYYQQKHENGDNYRRRSEYDNRIREGRSSDYHHRSHYRDKDNIDSDYRKERRDSVNRESDRNKSQGHRQSGHRSRSRERGDVGRSRCDKNGSDIDHVESIVDGKDGKSNDTNKHRSDRKDDDCHVHQEQISDE